MPRVFPNNKNTLKSKINARKHEADMTEEEKKNAASCRGMKQTHICKNPVYLCTECGNYGCNQNDIDVCTEQGFKNDKCMNCRVVGKIALIMESEYDEIRAEWEKEVPEIK